MNQHQDKAPQMVQSSSTNSKPTDASLSHSSNSKDRPKHNTLRPGTLLQKKSILFSIFVVIWGSWLVRLNNPFYDSEVRIVVGSSTIIGRVHRYQGTDVQLFGGIPYAEVPIRGLRFRPPVAKASVDTHGHVLDATKPGKACIQAELPGSMVSEDCLTITIYRPSGTSTFLDRGQKLPMMVWIHGGGYVVGHGGRYNGVPLVARSVERDTPVMVVTINYRLGPLGFPQSEAAIKDATVNLGLKDMLAALQWIKAHGFEFGGDPEKVKIIVSDKVMVMLTAFLQITVFGESAGARAIELLFFNGHLKGLVRGMILQSSGTVPTVPPTDTHRTNVWDSFVNATKVCTSSLPGHKQFDCLRQLDTERIIQAYIDEGLTFPTFGNWFPNLDNEIVRVFPSTVHLENLGLGNVAVMIGANVDEATFITPQIVSTPEQVRNTLMAIMSPSPRGEDALEAAVNHLLRLYPSDPCLGSPFGTGNSTFGLSREYKRLAAIVTDLLIHAERRMMLQKLHEAGLGAKAYSYLFADPNAASVFPPEFATQPYTPGSLGGATSVRFLLRI
ncbi:hypothetical protein VNI00_007248 [Paramarasmius palmivorus]|uniref:Carboxylesterase type B domain-containing protein n=1 Tax=Paramarasmius palmivorus TaxID=297713 RepID=A0AAW0D578_9AGAR